MSKRCDIDRDKVDSACAHFASQCKRACRELLAGLRLGACPGTTSVAVEPEDICARTYSSSNRHPAGKSRPSYTSLRSFSNDSENVFNQMNRKVESSKKEVRFTEPRGEKSRSVQDPVMITVPSRKIVTRTGSILVPVREESEDISAKAETIVDETITNAVEAIQKRLAPNAINQTQVLQCTTHCEQLYKSRNASPKPNGGRAPTSKSPKENKFQNFKI